MQFCSTCLDQFYDDDITPRMMESFLNNFLMFICTGAILYTLLAHRTCHCEKLMHLPLRSTSRSPIKRVESQKLDPTRDKRSDTVRRTIAGEAGQGYYVELSIGTPAQKLNILIDTGSSNFAVAAAEHPELTKYFIIGSSDTYVPLSVFVDVPYTQGHWRGRLAFDNVTLSLADNTSTTSRVYIACITESDNFFVNNSDWQGILGLAYASIARPDKSIEPFFDSLVQNLGIADVFSLQLCGGDADLSNNNSSPSAGLLVLGGADRRLYSGNMYYTPIVREDFYEVTITDIALDNNSLQFDCKEYNYDKTIVDSGTTNLRLPHKVYDALLVKMRTMFQLPPELVADEFWSNTEHMCGIDIESSYHMFPVISLLLAHNDTSVFTLQLRPQHYVRKADADSSFDGCFKLAISSSDTGSVIGSVVLESFYTVFNRSSKSIGFAESSCAHRDSHSRVSPVIGVPVSYTGNTTDCIYLKQSDESRHESLTVVSYVMAGICAVCILPLIVLIIRWQSRRVYRACCARRQSQAVGDWHGLLETH